ncbi:MAG: ABC transporter ATP-binding protein [Coriobacteriales bacterium]|jgi:putative spermidine/putrescine transport system ATP-binding protein|nr:ABC transporter ATP-binding protein [Coriobacteriales bacterium]
MSLRIENLDVSINRAHILYDINLDINDGEFFSLLGNSGSGKSTLLKTIAGLVQEQKGEIILGDLRLHELAPQNRRIAIVFQDMRLFPNMTVGENVTYSLRIRGAKKKERLARAKELLELVHLDGLESRHVHQLSGGQSQRVAIARALAAEPRVLLLDEPFSALDENLREEMRTFIIDIHKTTGLTTIMVTHNQHEALSISDRIAVMDGGRIIQTGTPQEIYTNPANLKIARYLADGDLLVGEVCGGEFHAGELTIACDQADGLYKVIVRESALKLGSGDKMMTVDAVRYHGHTSEVLLRSGDAVLRTSVESKRGLKVGAIVTVAVDSSQIIFFDAEASPTSTNNRHRFDAKKPAGKFTTHERQ